MEVLVVEDEPLVRMLLVDALLEEGYDVHEAENAIDALAILNRSYSIEALITDVVMPGDLTGLDLANWVDEHRPGTIVLVTSGYIGDAQARLASTKFKKFIQKPYRPDTVVAELRSSFC